MPDSIQRWMREVSRLTQSGRFAKAARFIQQSMVGSTVEPPSANPETVIELPMSDATTAPSTLPKTATGPSALAPRQAARQGVSLAGQHTEAGLTRAYILYLPPATASPAPQASIPLVVMLHGCSQSPDDFAAGTAMNELACEQGFAVLYPAQAHDANPGRCWNWYEPGHQQRGSGEPALLAGLTQSVITQHGLDAQRVYVAGLSAGGAMAAILGQAYPDLYAAVGIHSGLASGAASDLMSALSAMKHGRNAAASEATNEKATALTAQARNVSHPVPTIVFHGDSDGVVHPDNGMRAVEAAIATGELDIMDSAAALALVEQGVSPKGRGYTRTTHPHAEIHLNQAEHWLLHGGGHAWSGGSAQGSFTDPDGPDATREMWRFFSSHVQPERRSARG
jgi:poly(hydroxyalkanoate) depolymerase family esterase